jgi:dimethylglycine dehydrogenase
LKNEACLEHAMKTHARAVVIGGGVVGVSTLYHLAHKGWTDSVLLERKELTSGSTWHAAGLLPLFNLSYSVGQIHKYSVALYKTLQQETGQDVGFRQVSNIRLACTPDRLDEYRYYAGIARSIGVDVRFLTPGEVKEIWPLANTTGVIGAIQHPDDGYIQPADLTQALARGARQLGAEIHRNTEVTAINELPAGEWCVHTPHGDIRCEHLVFATGNFARKTGAMVGLDIPVIPVEHQYLVTEPHPEILRRRQAGLPEMGVLRESDASYYMREENGGLLLGPYETGAPCCYVNGPDPASEYELFQPDIDRLLPHIEAAIARVPAFGEVGIKRVYNGAIPYTPDGSPIVGPAWEKRNLWLNEGHSFGITAAGGAGWQLAEWIVNGEPTIDMMGVDPRRFGPYATGSYLRRKTEEAYRKVFTVHFPDEERGAARPLRRAPCYGRLASLCAVFGSAYGWERPGWFAPPGYALTEAEIARPDVILNMPHDEPARGGAPRERWSFRRGNYFPHVGGECRHVLDAAGLLDMSHFAKYTVAGPGAEAWLNGLFANRMPRRAGGIALCHLLTPAGGVRAEATVYRQADNSFYLTMAGAQERHDWDYLRKAAPRDGSVELQKVTTQFGVLVLAGPHARDILQPLADTDLGSVAFPWLTGKEISVGHAQATALRVNFVGELGWELHHPIEMQTTIFDLLMQSGEQHGLRPFGTKAMDSLRLEKSYRAVGRELSVEYSALESGLARFIRMDKPHFTGRQGLAERASDPVSQFVTLELEGVTDADARGSEPILHRGALAGRTTSGGYGWRVEKSLALAMVRPDLAAPGTELEVVILGTPHRATVIAESPYDPGNARLKA